MNLDVIEDVMTNMFKDYDIRESRVTPCVNHSGKRIQYFCKTERFGICGNCLFEHYKKEHEVLSLEKTIRNVRSIIRKMEESPGASRAS
jgi:tRNA/tmRNA/rRNA uracil-C5-methylase (TrmA/RlmC/RlmD family)